MPLRSCCLLMQMHWPTIEYVNQFNRTHFHVKKNRLEFGCSTFEIPTEIQKHRWTNKINWHQAHLICITTIYQARSKHWANHKPLLDCSTNGIKLKFPCISRSVSRWEKGANNIILISTSSLASIYKTNPTNSWNISFVAFESFDPFRHTYRVSLY